MNDTRRAPAGDYDYERHGAGYAAQRRPDPRIAALIAAELGDARTVLNVGAGAGSYEPNDRHVVAVEPSASMRAQRPASAAPAVDAVAESLPFADQDFDAAMASVTVHQWSDVARGIAELRRVSRGPVIVFTFDGDRMADHWLNDYVPQLFETERRRFGPVGDVAALMGPSTRIQSVPIPKDCTDGFVEAFWARPEAFLNPMVRSGQSAWGLTDRTAAERGLSRLADDLRSGEWERRYGHLRAEDAWLGSARLLTRPSAEPRDTSGR